MSDIRAGYMVKIRSYEGDADNYSTEDISGLTLEQARWYKHLGDIANDILLSREADAEDEFQELVEAMLEFDEQTTYDFLSLDRDPNAGDMIDFYMDRVGYPNPDYNLDQIRVIDDVRVWFVPEKIVDITANFARAKA